MEGISSSQGLGQSFQTTAQFGDGGVFTATTSFGNAFEDDSSSSSSSSSEEEYDRHISAT